MDLLLGNDKIDAAEALACGLVNRVVPAGQQLETALRLARDIAVNDRMKVAMVKQAINRSYRHHGHAATRLSLGHGDRGPDRGHGYAGRAGRSGRSHRKDGLKAALAWRDARFADKA